MKIMSREALQEIVFHRFLHLTLPFRGGCSTLVLLCYRSARAGLLPVTQRKPKSVDGCQASCTRKNPIERLNVEIKRRTDILGISPDKSYIQGLFGAILMEQTEEWTGAAASFSQARS